MNEAVELLLKRMDSHPEEFTYDWGNNGSGTSSKWETIRYSIFERMNYIMRKRDKQEPRDNYGFHHLPPLPFLTDNEVETLYNKFAEANAVAFRNYVMEVLVTGSNPRLANSPVATASPVLTTAY